MKEEKFIYNSFLFQALLSNVLKKFTFHRRVTQTREGECCDLKIALILL